jgi:hypothetical protein
MALSEADKSEIRRHLGYPDPGSPANIPGGPPYFASFGQANGMLGERMSPAFYQFEYRMINYGPTAEVALVGTNSVYFSQFLAAAAAQANFAMLGAPGQGEQITFQVDGEYIVYPLSSTDNANTICASVAADLQANADIAAVVQSTPTGPQLIVEAREAGNRWNSLRVRAWGSPSCTVALVQPGTAIATTTLVGGISPPGPSYVDPDQTPSLPIYGALPIVQFWERGIAKAEANFDMRRADVYVVEPHEYAKRKAAYIGACRDMAQQMGVQYFGGKDYRGNVRLKRRGA